MDKLWFQWNIFFHLGSPARLTVKAYPKTCFEGFLVITAKNPLFC